MKSAIFITFSGNCKQALELYQSCFGGLLQFDVFEKELPYFSSHPVVSGSLVADQITIYGSDLVPTEGRRIGNYISIYLQCDEPVKRAELIDKLKQTATNSLNKSEEKLVEITDAFNVRWILAIK